VSIDKKNKLYTIKLGTAFSQETGLLLQDNFLGGCIMQQSQIGQNQTRRGIVITGVKPIHVAAFVVFGLTIVSSFGFLVGVILGR